MDYRVFSFPTIEDGPDEIERRLYELERKERDGIELDQVEKDWIDYANNILWSC